MNRFTIALILPLALGACGSPGSGADDDIDVPEGRAGVIMEIRDEGGFIPVEVSLTRVPRFVVFDDGSVVSHQAGVGADDRAAPLFENELSKADFADLLTFAQDLALDDVERIDVNEATNVADAPTTVLTYFDESGSHELAVYALGFDTPSDPRAAILASMVDLLETATTPPGEIYQPPSFEILVSSEMVNRQMPVEETWPLETAPGEMNELGFNGWRCVVLDAEEIDRAMLMERNGVAASVWTFDGTPHTLLAKPLFPHEEGC